MAPPAAELAIAKASFSAVLFRPDPTSCSRDEIEQFHGLLGETISRCSPTNVQKCKQWALHHLVRSPGRAGSLGKYLVALANTYTPETLAYSPRPSAKRRRLHILYILGDIFYHTKRRLGDDTFIKGAEPHLPALVKSAASFSNCPKHIRKLESLINIWEDNGYFSSDFTKDLRRAVEDGPAHSGSANQSGLEGAQNSTSSSKAKEAPFVMPSLHGDASTPWYDLPAGNWLPAIEPNSTRPMNPSMIRPLQLASGPPDKTLVDAVKKLLVDVDKIYAKDLRLDGDTSLDIGQTGELIERDEINGDIISGDTYYGWSRAFCQRMKARRKNGGNDESRGRASSRDRSRNLSRSPSQDRSSSGGSPRPAFKRRRLSSTSRSRSGSARQERYRDVSRSPSRSRSRSRRRSYSRPGFQRSSRSYSRSRSPPSRRTFGRDFDAGPRSRSPHYSPPPSIPPTYGNNNHFNQPPPPPNMPPIAPPQPNYGGWNVPPPPPPPPGGYQGQWPPPPPAGGPPQQQNWFPPNSNHWTGGWGGVPPPPPPPPVPQQQGGYQYSRGGGGGYRGGRGGYSNRGRGW